MSEYKLSRKDVCKIRGWTETELTDEIHGGRFPESTRIRGRYLWTVDAVARLDDRVIDVRKGRLG